MKWTAILFVLSFLQFSAAHYIFATLLTQTLNTTSAVRQPAENSPVHNISSTDVTCNVNVKPASKTVSVKAGSKVGFRLGEGKKVYHNGPTAMYLGKAPSGMKAVMWDGSGKRWFKIAEWGAIFKPSFKFKSLEKSTFTAKIPSSVPSGEYLLRMEQLALHIPGAPEIFVGCAQLKITNGGTGKPKMVSIPGYIAADDPMVIIDIYWPVPTAYKVPGPSIYKG